ncbi:hypothetical protein [Agrobacterium tumefaciens]|uniref:hypothetical protein n=1 Tax=Agrobacterium tumefaciens TaxID=358 RepID=UPI0013013F65
MNEPLAGGRYVRNSDTEEFVRATDEALAAPAETTTETPSEEKTDDKTSGSSDRKGK